MGLTVICFVISSFLVVSAHSLSIKNVVCPNGNSCPDGNTCCPTGCCPVLNAVCCSGGQSCCPPGTSCGPDNRCYESSGYTQPPSRISAQVKSKNDTKVRNIVCPDQGVCTNQQTCCVAGNDNYVCCPEPHATCCSDTQHCCPWGTVCGNGACYNGDSKTKESTPILANTKMDKAQNVICPDGGSCPNGNTCCLTSSGGYGCCPSPGASCCSDGQHCCQNGYECSGSQCFPSGSLHPMMTLI